MLLFAAAAIAALPPPAGSRTATPVVQATATVRILSGVRLNLEKGQKAGDGFVAREIYVRTAGSSQPARLIEFE